jgi:hypothetical protein
VAVARSGGAVDGEFSATKSDGFITLSTVKSKDFEAYKPLNFSLKVAELDWLDDDGDPVTSVYLEDISETSLVPKKPKLSARDIAIFTSLDAAIKSHGCTPNEELKAQFDAFNSLDELMPLVVHIDHWRTCAYKIIKVNGKSLKSDAHSRYVAFDRAREKLITNGYVLEVDGYVFRKP